MSSLSQAATAAEKQHQRPLLDSGDAVYRHLF